MSDEDYALTRRRDSYCIGCVSGRVDLLRGSYLREDGGVLRPMVTSTGGVEDGKDAGDGLVEDTVGQVEGAPVVSRLAPDLRLIHLDGHDPVPNTSAWIVLDCMEMQ